MADKVQTFYYSRRKLGLYLLFNLGLLALAVLFTWSIFPDYQPVYYFALITCCISILSSLFVFLFRMPLAVIDANGIKIDHNQPLKWGQIKSVERQVSNYMGFEKPFLKITPQKIDAYKMTFMQRLAGNSHFGSFSIPLYAMSDNNAKQIEKLIDGYMMGGKPTVKKAEKKTAISKTAVKKATSKKIEGKKVAEKKAAVKKTTSKKAPTKKKATVKK